MYSVTLEPTSRCTLACPRCARTNLLEKFGKNALGIFDLNPDHIADFFDVPIEYFYLGGQYGDPIIHPTLDRLIASCKKHAPRVIVNTSGSGRNKIWWEKFVENLEHTDTVEFAIDGLPENFTQYRVNADWQQIEQAIKICVGRVKTIWKFIPFSFNETDIDVAKKLSKDLGIDQFNIEPSDRWLENDWLKPKQFTGPKEITKENYTQVKTITPKCADYRNQYISAQGYFMPCCLVHDYRFYYKSDWWHNKAQFDISKTTFSECIRHFDEFYSKINEVKPDYCVYNCGKCE